MNPLARRPLWLTIGWTFVLLVVVSSLLPPTGLPDVEYNDKLGHFLAYFSLMAWFGQLFPHYWKPALVLLGLGALLEVLQGLSGYRDMSGLDMVANAAGIGFGWLFSRKFPDLLYRLEERLP
jgi:VanZ family protein